MSPSPLVAKTAKRKTLTSTSESELGLVMWLESGSGAMRLESRGGAMWLETLFEVIIIII